MRLARRLATALLLLGLAAAPCAQAHVYWANLEGTSAPGTSIGRANQALWLGSTAALSRPR